ncbi:hypothetical protein [Pseudomonas viridiflava]|uniref:hypothetical protein n=1 Tax=Pseudomonas viridiflava TaxID=33069 RepID=UPI000F0324CE|nr:hypothetical protein [Pseudomonas viridiflava]
MSVGFPANNYIQAASEDAKRGYALAAALELIAARASGGGSVDLEKELENLPKYASLIQDAMKAKLKKR